MGSKKQKNRQIKAKKTLADRLIAEFKLKRGGDYIRFKEGQSRLTYNLAKTANDILLKYYQNHVPHDPPQLIHYASFEKNPLRYIFDMIEQSEISNRAKLDRIEAVHDIVKKAMGEDPLTTVQSIVYSLARFARF